VDEDLVRTIEADLRALVEAEINKFLERYSECTRVHSIYINEDFDAIIHEMLLHGLPCDYHVNIVITREQLYEIPEWVCWPMYEDGVKTRRLGFIKIVHLPGLNKCYVQTEIYENDIREIAEHIASTAEAQENA
jgi:hypothetical protein